MNVMMHPHVDPVAGVLLYGSLILFLGLMGRNFALRLNQPGVLGELLMGVLVGNVCYLIGMPLAVIFRDSSSIYTIMQNVFDGATLEHAIYMVFNDSNTAAKILSILQEPDGSVLVNIVYVIDIFSRYGVIFLLFMVGLDSSVSEFKKTGVDAMRVALIGVIAPIVLGVCLLYFLMPNSSFYAILFVAATLSATSVGITARVLKDLNQLHTRAAKTILGAAMLDDLLGLVILAIVSGIVLSGAVNAWIMTRIFVLACLFVFGSLFCGPFVVRNMVRCFSFLPKWEAKLLTAFLFVTLLSWMATLVQLATIIGAFIAGVILHDGFFEKDDQDKSKFSLKQLVAPLEALYAPLFFMLIGIQVKLETFLHLDVLIMASGLIFVAVIGKLLSGFGCKDRSDRLLIGIGMLPRGEVGLVFAAIGKSIGVISDDLFSAIILMIMVTTIIVPPWLKNTYARND